MMYKRYKTTMGRRYRMREPYDARMERILYWLAITVLPFVTAIGMTWMWVNNI